MAKYTEKDLIAAIKDLNKVLDCDPPLELEDDMEMDDLIESFKEGAEMAAKGDKFAKATVALAKKLKVSLGEAEEKVEDKKEDKKTSKKTDKKTPAKKTDKKDSKKEEKKPAAKKDDKKSTPKKAAAKDDYGFRPGCKKSLVMDLIKKGKSTMEDLKAEFGGQVDWAIKEAAERTGTKVKVTQKTKCVQIDKSK